MTTLLFLVIPAIGAVVFGLAVRVLVRRYPVDISASAPAPTPSVEERPVLQREAHDSDRRATAA